MWGASQHGTTVGFVASLSLSLNCSLHQNGPGAQNASEIQGTFTLSYGGAEGSRDHHEQEILPVFEKPACAVQRPSKVTQSHTDAQLER